MESIEILDGIIVAHYSSPKLMAPRQGGEIREITDLTDGAIVGTPVNQIDETGRLYSPEELTDKGILTVGADEIIIYALGKYSVAADYRHHKYWKKDTGQQVHFQIGEKPDETMTDVIKDDPDATWQKGKWIVKSKTLAERARAKRNGLLLQSDHFTMADYPLNNREELLAYRQALRDVPAQAGFPKSITWPKFAPEGNKRD